jgi:hypothetical protein
LKLTSETKFINLSGHCLRCLPFQKKKAESQEEPRVFVKGFSLAWTHQTLYESFKECGQISICNVSWDYENMVGKGYGTISFSSQEEA